MPRGLARAAVVTGGTARQLRLPLFVNAVAAILFILVARVAWEPAILIAVGSIIGGQVGARIGRRMPPMLLRVVIIVVGVVVSVRLFLG